MHIYIKYIFKMSLIDINVPVGFECGFQTNLDFMNRKYCFKYEYADHGKRCTIIGDDRNAFVEWFKTLPPHQRKLYELIRENDIVAEFYDIDFALNDDKSIEDIDDLSIQIIEVVLDARNEVSAQTISKKDIIVLSAHTSTKLSLHIVSKKTYFENNKLQRAFAMDVYEKLSDENFNIDVSVYSNNRCFRMFQNHKYGKDNTLVLFYPEMYNYASFEDTWVVLTHTDISDRIRIETYCEEDLIMRQHCLDNEVLTDDLKSLLHDFIEKHPYLKAESDPAKSINRLNRVDETTRQCLTDPSDSHSTENMFWYVRDHCLFVGCFCKKGQHLNLGMRRGIHRVNRNPEPFSYATHSSCDFKEYNDFPTFKTLYDKRRTGGGKTTCAMQYAHQFERVLLVHHRLSLDSDYIQKYPEFVSYQKDTRALKQTVCFNSLSKIDITSYDVIIIDEIRSILKQTEMKDMLYSTHKVFSIFENKSIPVIMLDANLTDADIEFIANHRPDPSAIIIHDDHVETDKNVFIVDGKDDTDLVNMIEKTIESKQKVVIVYNKSIEKINALLAPYEQDYRVLHINKHTRKGVEMNTDLWYDNFDIIAYSPTISEGVSVNDPRFKNVSAFGFFTSMSCPAESSSQMIARFRAIQNFTVHVNTNNTRPVPIFKNKKNVMYYIANNLQHLRSISEAHYNVRRESGNITIIEDEFCSLFCKNALEQSLDYHNYLDTFIQKLVNNGYNVFHNLDKDLSTEETVRVKTEIGERESIERKRMNQKILDVPLLSSDEFSRLRDNGISSEEDECKIQKYGIVQTINTEKLSIDIVDEFRDSATRYIVRNIKHCFGFIRNEQGNVERIPTRVLVKENALTIMNDFNKHTSFLDQKKCISSFNLNKVNWLNSRASELGFEYLLSPEGVPLNVFTENMERMIEYYKNVKNYKDYANSLSLFGKTASLISQSGIKEKFIRDKFYAVFRLSFGVDKERELVFQQINIPINFYDVHKKSPNLIGNIMLPDEVVRQYDTMFMKGSYGSHCAMCGVDIRGNIFNHVNSQKHQSQIRQRERSERSESSRES